MPIRQNAQSQAHVQPAGLLSDDNTAELQLFEQHVKRGEYFVAKHHDVTQPMNLLDDAIDAFAQALEIKPDDAETLGKLACLWIKKANYTRGCQLAQKAIALCPNQPHAHYVLGYVAYKSNRLEEGVQHLSKAVFHGGIGTSRFRFCLAYALSDLNQQSHNLLGNLVRSVQAGFYMASGLLLQPFEPNRLKFSNLWKLVPQVMGAYRKENRHDIDGALVDLLALYEQFPGVPSLQVFIGNLYQTKGLTEEALYWYRKAIYRDALNEEALMQMGRMLEDCGNTEFALEAYQKLLALKPNCPEIHCSIGNAYYGNGQFEQTVSHYRTALQLSNDRPWKGLIAQSLAKIYSEHLPNREAAENALRLAIELQPGEVDNYVQLGVMLFEAGDYQSAESLYQRATAIAPRHAILFSSLAYLHWMRDDIDGAIRLYSQALEIDPNYDIPHNNLGVIDLDTLGNLPRAIDRFEAAIRLNENYSLAYYNLGRAHSFLGNTQQAAEAFRKAQDLNEINHDLDSRELEDRIQRLFNATEG